MNLQGKWSPILIGGTIIGLGPFVPILNLACCLIPMLGAIVAVAVFRSSNPPSITNSDGVVLGSITAIVGTVIYAILIVPFTIYLGNFLGRFIGGMIPDLTGVPEHVRSLIDWIFSNMGAVIGFALFFKVLGHLALNLIFGILGGILGVALFKNRI